MDGFALGCPGPVGGGGVIRDDHGRLVKGFLRKIGKVNSLEAELQAIRDGLIICNQLLIQELYIELDAKAVISLLTNKTEYAPLIDDCRNLLNLHPTWKIQHCYWESNACVDALAKKVVFSQHDFCLLDTPPVEMSQLLKQDLSGLFCNRVCNFAAPVVGFQLLTYSMFTQKKKKFVSTIQYYLLFTFILKFPYNKNQSLSMRVSRDTYILIIQLWCDEKIISSRNA